MEGRREIEGDDQVPLGDREVLDGGNKLRACIVDEDIDAAEVLRGLRHHPFDRLCLREVGARKSGSYFMIPFETRPKRFDFLCVTETVEDHIGAFGGKPGRNRLADSAGRAGYEGGFSLEHAMCLLEARFGSGVGTAGRSGNPDLIILR